MARTFRLRVSTEARKLLRIVAPRPARWLWMVSLFFGLGCMMPVSAAAEHRLSGLFITAARVPSALGCGSHCTSGRRKPGQRCGFATDAERARI